MVGLKTTFRPAAHARGFRALRGRPTIKGSLAGLFAALALVALAQGLFGLAVLRSTNDRLATITKIWLPAVDGANDINVLINDIRTKQYRYFLSSESDLPAAERNLENGYAALAQARSIYEGLISSPAERDAYDRFAERWSTYSRLWREIPDLIRDGKRDAALSLFKTDMWTVSDEAGAALDQVVDVVRDGAIAAADSASVAYGRSRTASLLALAFASALALGAMAYSFLRVGLPLEAITSALVRLAAGDRDVKLPQANRRDEIGAMTKAFDVFLANTFELQDAHAALGKAQEEATALARHDVLTGLTNRRVFVEELGHALARSRAGSASPFVLLLDLEQFKPVNDLHGRQAGDFVLCEVARRLCDAVPKNTRLSRLEGDQFAILVEHESHGPQDAHAQPEIDLAAQLIRAVGLPIQFGRHSFTVGASIGIARFPTDGADTETLLRSADLALDRAKKDAPGSFRFFEQRMDKDLRERAAMEADLRQAIRAGDILPNYQPVVDLRTNQVCGFEVLARWRHPSRGFIPPDIFVPLAEHLKIVSEMTSSVLRRACSEAREWPSYLHIAINISAVELSDPSLPTRVLAILSATRFPPSRLEIEVTETALISDVEIPKSILLAFQNLGIKVALDDFGTGFSSLHHLRTFKFDKLKIDKSFVQSLTTDEESGKIVDGILGLARSFDVSVVAEGIETPEALARLVESGCALGQGYYFGKAVPAGAALELIDLIDGTGARRFGT